MKTLTLRNEKLLDAIQFASNGTFLNALHQNQKIFDEYKTYMQFIGPEQHYYDKQVVIVCDRLTVRLNLSDFCFVED